MDATTKAKLVESYYCDDLTRRRLCEIIANRESELEAARELNRLMSDNLMQKDYRIAELQATCLLLWAKLFESFTCGKAVDVDELDRIAETLHKRGIEV